MRTMGLVLLLFLLVMSCDKNDGSGSGQAVDPPIDSSGEETPPPTVPVSEGDAPYSGGWKGSVIVKDLSPNLCPYPDKLLETTQTWSVIGDSVQVAELLVVNRERLTYYWRGTIRNDTLEMTSKRNVDCGGALKLTQITFKAPIVALADSFRIDGYTLYDICKPNCKFDFTYQLSKAK